MYTTRYRLVNYYTMIPLNKEVFDTADEAEKAKHKLLKKLTDDKEIHNNLIGIEEVYFGKD